jgi:hypothetical protein
MSQTCSMIYLLGVLDRALRGSDGLIRESLEPKDVCERGLRADALIAVEANNRTVNGVDVLAEHTIDMLPRVRLISHEVQRECGHSVRKRGSCVPSLGVDRAQSLQGRQRRSMLAERHKIGR